MKVFVINLLRSKERLAKVSARLRELGVEWERIEAVDDSCLDESARREGLSRFGWWCCQLRPLGHGHLGCYLSHHVFQRMVIDQNLGKACVLEDDVVLGDRFPEVLAWVEAHLDETRAQVALLGDHVDGGALPKDDGRAFSLDRARWDWGAEAYVITAPAARAIQRDNYPVRVPCDTWDRWVRQGVIELFHVHPAVCGQTSWLSDSELAKIANVNSLPLASRIWWRLRRIVGVTLDGLSSWTRFVGAVRLVAWRFASVFSRR